MFEAQGKKCHEFEKSVEERGGALKIELFLF
jgi:hypothetical protein